MSSLDDAIKDAMTAEDQAYLDRVAPQQGVFSAIGGLFSGPWAFVNWVLLVFAILVGTAAVYAGYRFAIADTMRPLFYWGALAGFGLLVVTIIRLFFVIELHTNRVLREVKRLELQVARLSARLPKDTDTI